MDLKLFEGGDNIGISKKFEPRLSVDWIIDYYAILGVTPDATEDQIKLAYRALVQGYHPDKLTRVVKELQDKGENKMLLINSAYELLTNPQQKPDYDELLLTWNDPRTISKNGILILDINKATAYEFTHDPEKHAKAIEFFYKKLDSSPNELEDAKLAFEQKPTGRNKDRLKKAVEA